MLLAIMIDAYTDARDRASENALKQEIVSLLRLQAYCVTSSKQFASPEVASLEEENFRLQTDCKACRWSASGEEHADEENEKARIAAELREVVAAAMHAGHHKPVDQMDRCCIC